MAAATSRAAAAPPLAPRRRVVGPAPRPRRVSGPSRKPARTAPPPGADRGLLLGVLGLAGRLDALASHRLLDRLIRSRVWIGIVAFALIGIVTLQLGLLKLNAGIGRALEREGSLQRDNAALSIENSELATGNRVESQAGQLGMQLVSVAALQFLHSHARTDVARAAAALRAAPTQEAQQHEAAVSSTGEAPAGEEAAATSEGSSETPAASESTTPSASETQSAEAETPESSSASVGSQAAGEPESSSLPAGEGGGAAAPGG